MQTSQNETTVRPFAGLYLRTPGQTRFWGWSSRGWGKLHGAAAASRPVLNLAEWLRQAHERLDDDSASFPAQPGTPKSAALIQEPSYQHQPRNNRRFQFVCNRHMIGWVIR